ncbi:MAG: hypothetical protein GXY03_04940 [Solirubrobacterales bacterium]|nr:hypothetical protein [Solirubrobacterales bacterium]
MTGRPHGWLRPGWPLCFRRRHDTQIKDALDRAEAELAGTPCGPAR